MRGDQSQAAGKAQAAGRMPLGAAINFVRRAVPGTSRAEASAALRATYNGAWHHTGASARKTPHYSVADAAGAIRARLVGALERAKMAAKHAQAEADAVRASRPVPETEAFRRRWDAAVRQVNDADHRFNDLLLTARRAKPKAENPRLTYREREQMPARDFGLPKLRHAGEGGYPIEDEAHARAALSRSSEDVRRGRMSRAMRDRLVAEIHQRYPSMQIANPDGQCSRTLEQVRAAKGRAVRFLLKVAKKSAEAERFAKMSPQEYAKHKGWTIARGNPGSAEEMYTEFHGVPPRRTADYELPQEIPSEVAELGKLVEIRLAGGARLEFSDRKAVLAANSDGSQLYCIGQVEIDQQWLARRFDDSKELIDLGKARQVSYLAEKKFDQMEPIVYYHNLGEETGDRPTVLFNRRTRQLSFAGGAYRVEAPGIIN